MQHLAANIRHYRALNGMTLQDVGDELGGVHRTMVHQYEVGLKTPSVGRLSQLAQIFGVTVDQLLEERAQ